MPESMGAAMGRNITALHQRRQREEDAAATDKRIAALVTRFTGSLTFVYCHLLIVAMWVAVNLGLIHGVGRFDPSFVILATAASVEAIFLSTFVLISQNRAAVAADRRAELDLQINLLAEHEITRLVILTSAIARHLGLEEGNDEYLDELKRDIAPEAVLDTIDAHQKHGSKP